MSEEQIEFRDEIDKILLEADIPAESRKFVKEQFVKILNDNVVTVESGITVDNVDCANTQAQQQIYQDLLNGMFTEIVSKKFVPLLEYKFEDKTNYKVIVNFIRL